MTVDEYLELPYRIVLTHDQTDGMAGWVAEVEELPGCLSQGETPEDAVGGIRDAMAGWISVALEDGTPIPEPRRDHGYSGRFLLRVPAGLHADLARSAEHEGVSLNAFATGVLAGAVGWRQREPA